MAEAVGVRVRGVSNAPGSSGPSQALALTCCHPARRLPVKCGTTTPPSLGTSSTKTADNAGELAAEASELAAAAAEADFTNAAAEADFTNGVGFNGTDFTEAAESQGGFRIG